MGNEYTIFPKGLSEGIYLYPYNPNPPATIKTSTNSYLTVYDENMKTPLSGVTVAFDNKCYTTGRNGSIEFDGNKTIYPSVTFVKKGYITKTISLDLSNKGNVVYLEPEYDFNIKAPSVSEKVKLENSVNVLGYDIKWLDLDYKLEMGVPTGGRKGIEQELHFKFEYDSEKNTLKVIFGIKHEDDDGDVNTVSYNKMKNMCDTGNFIGELEIPFEITDDVLMSKTKIASIAKQTYTGKSIEPEVTVTYKKETLVKGKDYTVTYKNNTEVGKATVIVTGMSDYAGSKSTTFQIVGESIAKATVNGLTDKIYNGQEQTQKVTVTLNGTTLKNDTDYEVTYAKNINAGTAQVVIIGKGRYSGTIKKPFKITAYDLKADSAKLLGGVAKTLTTTYTKGGSTPTMKLTFDSTELVVKRDYTISYKNNKKPATSVDAKAPTLTIKGKGNFTGSIEIPFTITSKSLTDTENPVRISVPDMAYNAKAGKFMSKPVLIDSNSKKLKAGTDYEKDIVYAKEDGTVLTKADTPQVGDVIKVTITGKGYYTGTAEAAYKITQASFSKATITVKAQSYTGSTITLDADDITVNVGSTELKQGVDYEIVEDSYQNNVKKGTASVTIKGMGNYGGEKTVKFKVVSKQFVWFWNLFK